MFMTAAAIEGVRSVVENAVDPPGIESDEVHPVARLRTFFVAVSHPPLVDHVEHKAFFGGNLSRDLHVDVPVLAVDEQRRLQTGGPQASQDKAGIIAAG